jgi:hypothetical protein
MHYKTSTLHTPNLKSYVYSSTSSHMLPKRPLLNRPIKRIIKNIKITLHYITLHYITLHYNTLHYITLHYITLHYITLHYITLHYITLHYITLHSIVNRRDITDTLFFTFAKIHYKYKTVLTFFKLFWTKKMRLKFVWT